MKREVVALAIGLGVVLAVSVSAWQSQPAEEEGQFGALKDGSVKGRVERLEKKVTRLEQDLRALTTRVMELEKGTKRKTVRPGSRAAWQRLELGMAPDEVSKLLGKPLEVETTQPGQVTWRYERSGSVHFRDNKVTSWYQPHPRKGRKPKD